MFDSLNSWKEDTAQILVTSLPLQTFDSALVLAEQYLSEEGGWNPTDPLSPTGPGEPVNQATPDEAANSIVISQHDRIYQNEITATVSVKVRYNVNQTPGQSVDSIMSSIEADLRDYIANRVDEINWEFVSLDSYDGTSETGGFTTRTKRVEIYNQAAAGAPFRDIRAKALSEAITRFSLNETWNVSALYFETGSSTVVVIQKYTDTTFATIDSGVERQYIFKMDPVTYAVQTGIKNII